MSFDKYRYTLPCGVVDQLSRFESKDFVKFAEVIQKSLDNRSRVFVIGNGGSYDNARCFARFLRRVGCNASTPFHEDSYIDIAIEQTYENIYFHSLERENLGEKDVLITLSGSGNSENIIRAIDYAHSVGAAVLGLTGRDGGRMKPAIGNEHCVVVAIERMEAIEMFICAMDIY